MKRNKLESKPDAIADEPTLLVAQSPPADHIGFLDTAALLERLPISRGTLRNWMIKSSIPYIKGSGRRVLFDWPSVRESLLRKQRGGAA